MSPVNVKLPEDQLRRLDAAIAIGRADNRSDALRTALDHLLAEWDRQAWKAAWAKAVPDDNDEFEDLQQARDHRWDDLDGDR
jgi:Arc/MetJ-type ribon-helix-helix transcriptional regulator